MPDDTEADFARTGLPYADRIRAVGTEEPFRWLAAGWRDFRTAPAASIAIGLIVVVAGFALTAGLALAMGLLLAVVAKVMREQKQGLTAAVPA